MPVARYNAVIMSVHHDSVSHSVTLSWYWANQSLPYLHNAESHAINFMPLVWLDREPNSWFLAPEDLTQLIRSPHLVAAIKMHCHKLVPILIWPEMLLGCKATNSSVSRSVISLLLLLCILATSNVISEWVPTCDGAHLFKKIIVLPHEEIRLQTPWLGRMILTLSQQVLALS